MTALVSLMHRRHQLAKAPVQARLETSLQARLEARLEAPLQARLHPPGR